MAGHPPHSRLVLYCLVDVSMVGFSITGQSFSGLRVGPLDPEKKVPKVGVVSEARTERNKMYEDKTVYQKRDRTGFGGGFKIPEETRIKKENMKKRPKVSALDEDNDLDKDLTGLTKEEIFAHLNLGNADNGISGKNR